MQQARSSRARRRGLPGLRLLAAVAVGLVILGQTRSALRAQSRERSMFVSVLDSSGAAVEGLVLERGPKTTGGQRRDLLMSTATPDALDRLAGILTSQYEVVYARPASLIPPEQIAVRMRRDDLTARGTPVRR